jgi:hypothetical protein
VAVTLQGFALLDLPVTSPEMLSDGVGDLVLVILG